MGNDGGVIPGLTIREIPFAAIDFESAGATRGDTDTPIQIGIVSMRGGVIGDRFGSYIATDRTVVWSAQRVHGIGNAALAGAPSLQSLWPDVRKRLTGNWIVAHSAATEKRFLRAFPFHGFGPWVDTLTLARALDPDRESHALGDLADAYGLTDRLVATMPEFRWHDAPSDALASLVVLWHLIKQANWADADAETLLQLDDSAFQQRRAATRGRMMKPTSPRARRS